MFGFHPSSNQVGECTTVFDGAGIWGLIILLQSPIDGKPMLLTPEESIQIQVGTSLCGINWRHFFDFPIREFLYLLCKQG